MQFRTFVAQKTSGAVIPAAAVNVYLAGTSSEAALFDEAGDSLGAQPISASATGTIGFAVADGWYDVKFTSGTASYLLENVQFFDGPAARADIDAKQTPPAEGAFVDGDKEKLDQLAEVFVSIDRFNVPTDGSDGATQWEAAMDYLEGLGGGTLLLSPNATYHLSKVTCASNVTVLANGATLAAHSSTPETGAWLINRDVSADGTRTARNIQIHDLVIDMTDRPYTAWLSQADGTPVTDPEADYVMGTGVLASGISGVDLTAVVTGGAVSSVTITNGGTGWNGHPTAPYQPNTVQLRFDGGGGSGAVGFGTISGGTITSVTVTSGGSGYTSAPTVTTRGGYADPSILVSPSVDRRNPDYNTTGQCIYMGKVDGYLIKNARFVGRQGIGIVDAGCRNGVIDMPSDDGGGKDDGPFPLVWASAYGTVSAPEVWFADTENILIDNVRAKDLGRSAVFFSPSKGGTLRNTRAEGCGEATVITSSSLCANGGQALIDGGHLSNNKITDISGGLIDLEKGVNVKIRDITLEGAALQAIGLLAERNVTFENVTFIDNCTGLTTTEDMRFPYGPFSERVGFGVGQRPKAGEALYIPDLRPVPVGYQDSDGATGVKVLGGEVIETRSQHPDYFFSQFKAGGNNLLRRVKIEGLDFTSADDTGMEFWDTSSADVFAANIPFSIRDCAGHASAGPVKKTVTITGTGLTTIDCGFRPSSIQVFASRNNTNIMEEYIGTVVWTEAASSGAGLAFSTDAAQTDSFVYQDDFARLLNRSTGATDFLAELSSWTETGFVINTGTFTANVALYMICHP